MGATGDMEAPGERLVNKVTSNAHRDLAETSRRPRGVLFEAHRKQGDAKPLKPYYYSRISYH